MYLILVDSSGDHADLLDNSKEKGTGKKDVRIGVTLSEPPKRNEKTVRFFIRQFILASKYFDHQMCRVCGHLKNI